MMTLDAYMAEAEKVILTIKKKLSFGYYDQDDIAQEARIYALETFAKYDQVSPPQPFIRICLTNKLNNLYRKKCRRSDSPCKICRTGVGCIDLGDGGETVNCEVYKTWVTSQNTRYSLMHSADISEVSEEGVGSSDPLCDSELSRLLDTHLPADLRGDYLKMLADVGVAPARRAAVQAAVASILRTHAPCLLPENL